MRRQFHLSYLHSALRTEYLVQPARLELALLDPQLRRHLRIVAAHLLDELLRILATDEVSTASPSGKSGERASSTTA